MPSSNRSTSHYQRFIPSEEVQVVSAWTFSSMDGRNATEPEPEPTASTEAAPDIDSTLQTARQEAYVQGFEEGKRAGAEAVRQAMEQQMHQEVRALGERVERILSKATADLTRLEDTLAAELLELACDVARQVVRRELSTSMEPLRAVVQEALSLAVTDGRPATLRLHPDDLARLTKADTDSQPSVKWVADDSLTPGGCVVDSAHSNVDARVEKRWARAVANLGLELTWSTPTPPSETEADHG